MFFGDNWKNIVAVAFYFLWWNPSMNVQLLTDCFRATINITNFKWKNVKNGWIRILCRFAVLGVFTYLSIHLEVIQSNICKSSIPLMFTL